MKLSTETLEEKVEHPDWKQFIPVFGLYQAWHAVDEGTPSICDWGDEHPVRYYGAVIYHVAALYGTIHLSCEAIKRFL